MSSLGDEQMISSARLQILLLIACGFALAWLAIHAPLFLGAFAIGDLAAHPVLGVRYRRLRQFGRRLLYPREPVWSIGIYSGTSPFTLGPPENIRNPALTSTDVTDVPARFVADPFMLKKEGLWYMLFEVFNQRTAKGEIGLAVSRDGAQWTYQEIVLVEPFHLSYPYVFEHGGTIYMVPESHKANCVRLYEAVSFPRQWAVVATLLDGGYFADTSVFRHDNMWWLFTETSRRMKFDTLRLFYSDNLLGPWREHSESPIIVGNAHIARPAGRVLTTDGRIIRFAQDCCPTYGTKVYALEVTDLSTKRYQERALSSPILVPSGTGWNGRGMHQVDPHQMDGGWWIACVDGLGPKHPRTGGPRL